MCGEAGIGEGPGQGGGGRRGLMIETRLLWSVCVFVVSISFLRPHDAWGRMRETGCSEPFLFGAFCCARPLFSSRRLRLSPRAISFRFVSCPPSSAARSMHRESQGAAIAKRAQAGRRGTNGRSRDENEKKGKRERTREHMQGLARWRTRGEMGRQRGEKKGGRNPKGVLGVKEVGTEGQGRAKDCCCGNASSSPDRIPCDAARALACLRAPRRKAKGDRWGVKGAEV